MAVLERDELGLRHEERSSERKVRELCGSELRNCAAENCAPNFAARACMQMSMSCDSLRKVRAIAMAFTAWFAACGPIACSVGQSTGARACAAISIATSRGLLPLPIFVRLFPLAMRSSAIEKKREDTRQ